MASLGRLAAWSSSVRTTSPRATRTVLCAETQFFLLCIQPTTQQHSREARRFTDAPLYTVMLVCLRMNRVLPAKIFSKDMMSLCASGRMGLHRFFRRFHFFFSSPRVGATHLVDSVISQTRGAELWRASPLAYCEFRARAAAAHGRNLMR